MWTAASALVVRMAPVEVVSRRGKAALGVVAFLHVTALAIMVATEVGPVARLVFVLVWALFNCLWLGILRRPVAAALVTLTFVVALILLSQFKHDKLWMTVDFIDVMIVDQDTSAFLLTALPSLRLPLAVAAIGIALLLAAAWRFDPLRVQVRTGTIGGLLCLGGLIALSLSYPTDLYEDFFGQNYVSKFARTGVEAVREYVDHGFLESNPGGAEDPTLGPASPCSPARKLPHIILLHDESSFDITAAPGMKVPAGYDRHFQSFDGKARKLVVEGAGGPSWFTEYNVLTGLSARSYGRFATSVTRLAAGRVTRGLPLLLSRCGYQTFSLYPFYGAFLSSRAFQTTAGIEHYLDMRDLGTRNFEADDFYFDRAIEVIKRERSNGPLFLYVYTVANHFPWDTRLRPGLTPNWHDLGNPGNIDEYIRRQGMTAHDYRVLLQRLADEFPAEPFLIVRYGDHQPEFGRQVIDPSLSQEALARQLQMGDTRYFTTYYAVDAVNFTPADLSPALYVLDAPYLPLVVLQAAGVPLDASFSEQKKILDHCQGQFYRCDGGVQVRRFNRLLIEAGLIRGL